MSPDAYGRAGALWTAAMPLAEAMNAGTAPAELATPAYVSEGRWVVMCPDCGGAQLAARDDWRFMCVECANVAIEGLWRPVAWPDEHEDIETELERRPMRRNQNWLPGETVEDLAAEWEAILNPPEPPEVAPYEDDGLGSGPIDDEHLSDDEEG